MNRETAPLSLDTLIPPPGEKDNNCCRRRRNQYRCGPALRKQCKSLLQSLPIPDTVPLPPVTSDRDYLSVVREIIEPLAREFGPEVLVLQAGQGQFEKSFRNLV
ncbi:MAG: hypothetical protein ACOCZX_00025 [Candidatus Bipolaricaulota bacterium]